MGAIMGFLVESNWKLRDEIDEKDKKIKELTHCIESLEETLFQIYSRARVALKAESDDGWGIPVESAREALIGIYRYSEQCREDSIKRRK